MKQAANYASDAAHLAGNFRITTSHAQHSIGVRYQDEASYSDGGGGEYRERVVQASEGRGQQQEPLHPNHQQPQHPNHQQQHREKQQQQQHLHKQSRRADPVEK